LFRKHGCNGRSGYSSHATAVSPCTSRAHRASQPLCRTPAVVPQPSLLGRPPRLYPTGASQAAAAALLPTVVGATQPGSPTTPRPHPLLLPSKFTLSSLAPHKLSSLSCPQSFQAFLPLAPQRLSVPSCTVPLAPADPSFALQTVHPFTQVVGILLQEAARAALVVGYAK